MTPNPSIHCAKMRATITESACLKMRAATLGAILVLTVYFALAWFLMREQPRLKYDPVNWPEKEYVIQRMKYHGISGCIQDEKGYYFIRDGKRCRL